MKGEFSDCFQLTAIGDKLYAKIIFHSYYFHILFIYLLYNVGTVNPWIGGGDACPGCGR